jgi:hypothetical protein
MRIAPWKLTLSSIFELTGSANPNMMTRRQIAAETTPTLES